MLETPPRRIGLSATLGDYSQAEAWLHSHSDRLVITPEIQAGQRKVQLAVEHFSLPKEEPLLDKGGQGGALQGIRGNFYYSVNSYYEYIFNQTKFRKCLIFALNYRPNASRLHGDW